MMMMMIIGIWHMTITIRARNMKYHYILYITTLYIWNMIPHEIDTHPYIHFYTCTRYILYIIFLLLQTFFQKERILVEKLSVLGWLGFELVLEELDDLASHHLLDATQQLGVLRLLAGQTQWQVFAVDHTCSSQRRIFINSTDDTLVSL